MGVGARAQMDGKVNPGEPQSPAPSHDLSEEQIRQQRTANTGDQCSEVPEVTPEHLLVPIGVGKPPHSRVLDSTADGQ